jgi:peptide chain release factor subunit 1
MQINQMTELKMRDLAEYRPRAGKVLSVYVDLNIAEHPTPDTRVKEIELLVDEAEQHTFAETNDLSHQERVGLRSDMETMRHFLLEDFAADGALGVALFACKPAGLFRAYKLDRAIRREWAVGDQPLIRPLLDHMAEPDWFVLLVNHRYARILGSRGRTFAQIETLEDPVPGKVSEDKPNSVRAHYQRHVDKEIAGHVQRACDRLFEIYQKDPFERLIVGAQDELRPVLEAHLNPALRKRLVGHVVVDIENATVDKIAREAQPLLERCDAEAERALMARLDEDLARGRAASGLADVLDALGDKRVETLFLDPDYHVPGVVCLSCARMGEGGETCSSCGGRTRTREDIVEEAIRQALAQSARVQTTRTKQAITALLRY